PEVRVDVPAGRLPEPSARPDRAEVVAQAQARRGDLVQASTFADLVSLEADAQATSPAKRMETFAAGGDIHSRPVPQEVHDNEYLYREILALADLERVTAGGFCAGLAVPAAAGTPPTPGPAAGGK